jgi:hypothetical protein
VKLTTHLHPVPRLRMRGAMSPLLHTPSEFVKLRTKFSCVATLKKYDVNRIKPVVEPETTETSDFGRSGVAPHSRIRKVLRSNLGWNIGCPDRVFVLSLNPEVNRGINVPRLSQDCFIPNPFLSTIHQSPYLSTL